MLDLCLVEEGVSASLSSHHHLHSIDIQIHFAGVSSRDLSPVDMVREYWSDCKDEMVEDMERIYER